MSQIFEIAIELIFERHPVKWVLGTARPTSWRPSDDWNLLGMTIASPAEYAGRKTHLSHGVLPKELRAELSNRAGPLSHKSRQREFEIIIGHVEKAEDESIVRVNPWPLRDEFFGLKKTSRALVEFLNKCGPWSEELDFGAGTYSTPQIAIFLPDQFWHYRPKLLKALNDGTSWERTYSPNFPLHLRAKFPHLFLEEKHCFNAMMQTVALDHLRGVKFKICAREDCRIPFAITSNHPRMYHDQPCAHLADIRRGREKERLERALSAPKNIKKRQR